MNWCTYQRYIGNLSMRAVQVAMVVDRVLLLIFTTTTLGITAAILLHAPLSRDFLFGSDFTVDLAGNAATVDNQTSNSSSMWWAGTRQYICSRFFPLFFFAIGVYHYYYCTTVWKPDYNYLILDTSTPLVLKSEPEQCLNGFCSRTTALRCLQQRRVNILSLETVRAQKL